MKHVYIILIIFMSFITLKAHDTEALPMPIVSIEDTKLEAIELRALSIETRITGNIAQTTYEMGFYNPNNRVLEGELAMPLLEGQAVVGYALEVNGAYRDAVVVEKAKAKESFENTVRQNIDPAIIEKTLGNNYKLRLYPIPKKGMKKLKVVVEELLSSRLGSYHYVVPFVSDKPIKEFFLDVKILSNYLPTITGLENIEVKPFATGYFVEYKKQNIKLEKMIELKIPKLGMADSYFQSSSNADNWFMSIVDKQNDKLVERRKPKKLEIIVDSSLNLGKKNLEKELDFLDKVFADLLNCTVSLKRLDIKMHDMGTYKVSNGNWTELKSRLQNIKYNGAKDLSKLKVSNNVDEVLFFSNGINTFSDSLVTASSMVTINSSLVADHNSLKYISKKYINLLNDNTQSAFKKYKYNHRAKVEQISNNVSEVFIKDLDESYVLIGRINGKEGSVDFSVGEQNYSVKIDIKKESKLLSRVWAKEKIDALSLHYSNNKEEIANLAKKYTIVSKNMSLIILDRVEDYVRYEIVPPKELQEKYYTLLEKQVAAVSNEKKEAIEQSIKLLEEQKVWYKKGKLDFALINAKEIMVEVVEIVEEVFTPVQSNAHKSAEPMPNRMPSPMPKKSNGTVKGLVEKKITLREWESNAPYLKTIKASTNDKRMKTYYTLQKEYAKSIPFYLDMADFFYKQNKKEDALLILSNILELDFEKSEYMRAFAFKLLELKFEKVAVWFFEKIEKLRPFEAQASRDLALCYERVGSYQKALEKHYYILGKNWNARFEGSKIITINELNRLISTKTLDTSNIDKRLIADMPVEIRIVINWSTDNSDMDLWVIDANNEKTYYSHKESSTGGKISNDMMQGYGPEEFMIKKAIKGDYIIKVKYFASHEQKIMGETVIRAEIYTDYATGKEQKEEIVFRVKDAKEVIEIGKISYEK